MFYQQVSLNMNTIYHNIFDFIHDSKEQNFNIRIEIDVETLDYSFAKFKGDYPTKSMYQQGVSLSTYNHLREHPNVKLAQKELKDKLNTYKRKNKVYEVLYINDDKVYECSSSNIFFIRGKKVYTSKNKDVLVGITRSKVIDVCKSLGYEVVETDLFLCDINKMNASFITGTSKNVLPVKKINLKNYNVQNKMLRKIMKAFDELIKEAIE